MTVMKRMAGTMVGTSSSFFSLLRPLHSVFHRLYVGCITLLDRAQKFTFRRVDIINFQPAGNPPTHFSPFTKKHSYNVLYFPAFPPFHLCVVTNLNSYLLASLIFTTVTPVFFFSTQLHFCQHYNSACRKIKYNSIHLFAKNLILSGLKLLLIFSNTRLLFYSIKRFARFQNCTSRFKFLFFILLI